MQNVTTSVSGKTLTITVDLSQAGEPSATGKSLVIASTKGNHSVDGAPEFTLGLNLYRAAPKQPKAAKASK
jgi:hypothetical protein